MKDFNGLFRLQADPSATLSWRVSPERNLLELCYDTPQPGTSQVCLTRQLEPRLMKLLCLLAAAGGQVLTRDELMTALWPRVVVNENSLTRAVSELRKALNPAPLAPAYGAQGLIETVPKRGYRLDTRVLPLDVLPPEPLPGNTPVLSGPGLPVLPAAARRSVQRPWSYAVLGLAMAVSAVLSSLWTQHSTTLGGEVISTQAAEWLADIGADNSQRPAQPVAPASVLGDHVINDAITLPEGLEWRESLHVEQGPLVTDAGSPRATVVAPDGRFMAFVEEFPGQSQLRLRSLVEPGEAWTVFTSHGPITHLQWSPLDAGLLFSVEDAAVATPAVLANGSAPESASPSRLARLMLLDLESMEIRELYRRAVPAEQPSGQPSYTSGNLT